MRTEMAREPEYYICPHCGYSVKTTEPACPGCGLEYDTVSGLSVSYRNDDEDNGRIDYKPVESRPWNRYIAPAVAIFVVCVFVSITIPFGIFFIPLFLLATAFFFYATRVYPKTKRGTEKRLEREFLRLLHGDRDQMERLVGYEMMRRPGLTRSELVASAMERLLRDRR
jgi:hypothetical protein